MFKNVSRLSRLAETKKNITWNLFLISIGSSCILCIWDGSDKKKNLKKVPWILTSSFYSCITYSFLFNEQSNGSRGNGFTCSWHEWYSYGRLQSIVRNKIYYKHFISNRIHLIINSMGILQNVSFPILFIIKRLYKCSTSNWRMVND